MIKFLRLKNTNIYKVTTFIIGTSIDVREIIFQKRPDGLMATIVYDETPESSYWARKYV